jgi:hypothetical protein
LVVVKLLSDDELLVSDFVSRCIVSSDDPLHSCLRFPQALLVVSNQQHVLLIFIVRLRR